MEQWMTKLAADIRDQWERDKKPAYGVPDNEKPLWQREAESAAKNDLAEHKGWTVNMKAWKPSTWMTIFRGPNQVDEDWLASKQKESINGADKNQTNWNNAYSRSLEQTAQDPLNNAIRKDTAALHIGAKIGDNSAVGLVDDALSLVPGLGWKGWTHYATGQTAEELLQDYKRQMEEQYGAEAAADAEKKMRWAGNIAGLVSAGSTAAAMGYAAGPANAAKPASGMAKAWTGFSSGAGKLNRASKILQGAARTYRVARPIGASAKAYADLATNGWQDVENPWLARSAQAAQLAGDIADSIPKYQAAMGALNPLVSRTLGAVGKVPGLGLPARAANALWRYAGNPSSAATRAKYFWDTAAKGVVQQTVVTPLFSGIDVAATKLTGKEPGPKYWGLGENLANTIAANARVNDTLYPYIEAGTASETFDKIRQGILNGPDDPEYQGAVAQLQRNNVQIPADATPQKVLELWKDNMVNDRARITNDSFMLELDPDAESWNKLSPEAREARIASFPPEQRREAKKRTYMWQMSRGGPQDFNKVFSDTDLNWDDKKSLLSDLIMAEDKLNEGFGSTLVGEAGRALIFGQGDVAGSAAEVSQTAQDAILAYTKNLCTDMRKDPAAMKKYMSAIRGSERLKNAISYDKWKEALSPVADATAAEQFAIVDVLGSTGSGTKDEMVQMVHDMCLQRMVKDDKYAADLLYEVAKRSNDSTLPAETTKPFVDVFLHKDPNKLFKEMDVKQYDTVTRWLMSNEGGGFLSTLPPERQEALVTAYTQAAKDRATSLLKENPFNIQVLSSLWAHSKGYDAAAKFLGDPIMFWGSAILLLTGMFLIGTSLFSSGNDSNSERLENKIDKLKDEMDRQRKLMTQPAPATRPAQTYEDPYSYYQNI